MSEPSIYELVEPTVWAARPETFSYSSLQLIRACPRRWLLLNSRWGEFAKFPQRAVPSAIEGQIVHEALDRLAKALGLMGRPHIGTPDFSRALEGCDFWKFFSDQIAEWNARLAQHPRATANFALRATPSALANRAVRFLRDQYQPSDGETTNIAYVQSSRRVGGMGAAMAAVASGNGSVSELLVRHPTLPFVGVLDFVKVEGGKTTIVDFKTGKPKPEHQEQLETYALLWWRATSQMPSRVVVQYLGGSAEKGITLEQLELRETFLQSEIDKATAVLEHPPSEAQPGSHCEWCPVRARCNEGWAVLEGAVVESRGPASIDIELVVVSSPTATGYLGRRNDGAEVAVVFDAAVGSGLPPLESGSRVRLLDALKRAGHEIELKAWTEIYVLPSSPSQSTRKYLVGDSSR